MVTPLALMAAMPVGATTTIRLGSLSLSVRRKVVFPVPALPVKNMLAPVFFTNCQARFISSFFIVYKSLSCLDALESISSIG